MIQLYTLLDRESKTTNHPMPFTTKRDAIDGLREVVNDDKTSINKHPDDFVLMLLGEYDQRTQKFNLIEPPEKIIEAKDLLQ